MRVFDVYYSGVITIEAETEEEAREKFYRNIIRYGDIDKVQDVTTYYENLKERLDNITD